MDNKIMYAVIAAIAGVILVSGVFIPIVEDSKDSMDREYTTDATVFVDEVTDFTLTKDENSKQYTVNDVTYDLVEYPLNVLMTDTFTVYSNPITDSDTNALVIIDKAGFHAVPVTGRLTITGTNGTATIMNGAEETSETYTWSYARSTDGAYGYVNLANGVSLNNDSVILMTQFKDSTYCAMNGNKCVFINADATSTVDTSKTSTSTAYPDIQVVTAVSATDGTVTFAPDFAFVPVSVIGHIANASTYQTLISVIPVLVVLGLIMTVCGAVIIKKL